MSDGQAGLFRSRALVLGGGGVAGVAWETGVLFGLAEQGVDLRPADLIVGTSAGATVAAQITSGVSLAALFERQLEPPEESGEIAVAFDVGSMMEMFASAVEGSSTPTEVRAAIGAVSLRAATVSEETRRAVIERRLPCHEWPEQTVRFVTVDALTGEPVVLDKASGVKLVDAVAASCAVPGIWPAVTINGRRYIDGGVRSGTNADLAASYETVVILRPFPPPPGSRDATVSAAIAALVQRPFTLEIAADEVSLAAMGTNPLDPATRGPSAHAGRAQGHAVARAVAALW